MPGVEAARRLEQLFGDGSVATEAGFAGWEELVDALPDSVCHEPAEARLPGFALAQAAREHWSRAGELRPAAALTRGLVRLLADRLGPGHADVLSEVALLGTLAERAGRLDRAEELLRQAWEGLLEGGATTRLPAVGRRLAGVLVAAGRPAQAERVLEICLARAPDGMAAAVALLLADLRHDRPGEAMVALLEGWRRRAGASAAVMVSVARHMGRLAVPAGRAQLAVDGLRQALPLAAGDPEVQADVAWLLVQGAEACGLREEATRTLEVALAASRRGDRRALAARLHVAAGMFANRGRAAEAEGLLVEALDAERRLHGQGSVEEAGRLVALGRFALRQGRAEEAAGWLEPAVSTLRRRPGPKDELLVGAVADLVAALVARAEQLRAVGDTELAEAWAQQATTAGQGTLPGDHPAMRAARTFHGRPRNAALPD